MGATILTGMTVLFIGGGLGMARFNREAVPWFSWRFPNAYAVDSLRDVVLLHAWPVGWTQTLLTLAGFAALSLVVGAGIGGAAATTVGVAAGIHLSKVGCDHSLVSRSWISTTPDSR